MPGSTERRIEEVEARSGVVPAADPAAACVRLEFFDRMPDGVLVPNGELDALWASGEWPGPGPDPRRVVQVAFVGPDPDALSRDPDPTEGQRPPDRMPGPGGDADVW